MIRGWTLTYAMTCAILLCSCGPADNAPPEVVSAVDPIDVTITDSAGVTIVTHDAEDVASVPRSRPGEIILTLGGSNADADHDASPIARAWFTAEGFLTFDPRAMMFRLFDTTGAVLGAFGGPGEPPGQFGQLLIAQAGPDSIGLVDIARGTWQVLRLDLNLGAPLRFIGGPQYWLRPFGLTAEGVLIGSTTGRINQGEFDGPSRRDPVWLMRHRRGSVIWDTLRSFQGELWYPVRGNEGGKDVPAVGFVEFGPFPISTMWQDKIALIENSERSITVIDPSSGRVERLIRMEGPLRPVTSAMRDSSTSAAGHALDQLELPPAAMERMRTNLDQRRFADSVAPYDRVITGRGGRLWLREYLTVTDKESNWLAFDSTGRLAERLILPTTSTLLASDGDRVLIKRVDPDNNLGYLELRRIAPDSASP